MYLKTRESLNVEARRQRFMNKLNENWEKKRKLLIKAFPSGATSV